MSMSRSLLASPCTPRPRCAGSSDTRRGPTGVPHTVHVHPTSWSPRRRALFLLSLAALPATVFAVPLTPRSNNGTLQKRQDATTNNNNSNSNSNASSNGSISMSVWLPILFITIMFMVFSFVVCLRRCVAGDPGVAVARTPANRVATVPRRRPRRTPSQISTKSLPPYMKEPGDQELVLYRGPAETEDDVPNRTFDIALDRIESVDTMADASSTNLIRRVSELVARPPEAHHGHGHRRSASARSLDSTGSDAELLSGHHSGISVDNRADARGEAPAYTETVAMATVSLNDPEPNIVNPYPVGGGHSRFSFLRHNPFSSHHDTNGGQHSIRSESPAQHVRSGSALSRFSSRESHDSHHSRPPSRNLSHLHSRSNSNLLHVFRSHSPGLPAGSSTISLDSISAPLTHTLKRAEFHAPPKGGLLTPEQVKLITSREALERFGVPYGPDAVAAFSRERLPPPDFESVAGQESGGSVAPVVDLETAPPRSTGSQPSLDPSDANVDSRVSTAVTGHGQTVQGGSGVDDVDEPDTARPLHL